MDIIRNGRFTSSEIFNLISNGKKAGEFGKPFYTYVKKKAQEVKLGRSMNSGDGGKATKWGSFVENWLMFEKPDIIGLEYTLTPKSTKKAPLNYGAFWCGSKDGFNNNTNAVIDLKCPYTLDSFADFADCKTMADVRENHKDGEKYYWQLLSNAFIEGVTKAELIVYMPTLDDLQEIMFYAINGSHDISDIYFIGNAKDDDLPYVTDKCSYNNVLKFEFDIPTEDTELLKERVYQASKLLVEQI